MSYPDKCPLCYASMQGDPIPEENRKFYGTATHYSRLLGISDGDSVGYWKCPDCGYKWHRAGAFAAQARRNIDAKR